MDKKRTRFELRLTKQELTDARKSASIRETSVSELIRAFLRRTAVKDGKKCA